MKQAWSRDKIVLFVISIAALILVAVVGCGRVTRNSAQKASPNTPATIGTDEKITPPAQSAPPPPPALPRFEDLYDVVLEPQTEEAKAITEHDTDEDYSQRLPEIKIDVPPDNPLPPTAPPIEPLKPAAPAPETENVPPGIKSGSPSTSPSTEESAPLETTAKPAEPVVAETVAVENSPEQTSPSHPAPPPATTTAAPVAESAPAAQQPAPPPAPTTTVAEPVPVSPPAATTETPKEAPAVKSPPVVSEAKADDKPVPSITSTGQKAQALRYVDNGNLQNPVSLLDLRNQYPAPRPFELLHESLRRYYATDDMAAMIDFMGKYLQILKPGTSLYLLDIAQRTGGKINPACDPNTQACHTSHQNGLDADIAYVTLKPVANPVIDYRKIDIRKTMDVEKQFQLFKEVVRSGKVEVIFVDEKIKQVMCLEAGSEGAFTKGQEDKVALETLRILYHIPDHYNHFHMRLKCDTSTQIKCIPRAPFLPKVPGCTFTTKSK